MHLELISPVTALLSGASLPLATDTADTAKGGGGAATSISASSTTAAAEINLIIIIEDELIAVALFLNGIIKTMNVEFNHTILISCINFHSYFHYPRIINIRD